MEQDATYYKARMDAIIELIKAIPVSDEKNNDGVLLRNGLIPEKMQSEFDKALTEHRQAWLQVKNKQPLSFTELCSFNTWFAMHPEKVAGVEYVTTSREFPIMVKGTKEDIIETVSGGLNDSKDKRVRIVKAQATAKLKLLALVELSGTDKQIIIGVRDAKRWVKQGDMFFVVRSWFREGRIQNKIYEPKDDPYIKYIEVGNGSLILDLDNYTLLWQE